jgi:hypothetical protein
MEPVGPLPRSENPTIESYFVPDESNPPLVVYYLRSILISYVRGGLLSGIPSSFPTTILCIFHIPMRRSTCPNHLILVDLVTLIIFM